MSYEESPPLDAYADEPAVRGLKPNGAHQHVTPVPYSRNDAGDAGHNPPLNWEALEDRTPPERDWAIEHWLGMGHVTLFAGAGGAGKTGVAQSMGSCLALRREYLDWLPSERRVLMWACEDEHDELWRRQAAIAKWLDVPLSAFSDRLFIHSYHRADVELAGLMDQRRLVGSPMLKELREQIGDYRAGVVFLDNIARLFGGNENDRHQVSAFIAMLTAVSEPTNAAMVLLGHPGKAVGAEYSGSTAWEGAARARWYLGSTLPDAAPSDDDAPTDDRIRYLSRRKANYSARDWRRITYTDGVMVPDAAPEFGGKPVAANPDYAADVVERAVRTLAGRELFGVASRSSPNYLPKLAKQYKLLENVTDKQFANAMRDMHMSGRLSVAKVGTYQNRTPRTGFVLADPAGPV